MMNHNPFDFTKATDLSNRSIYDLWVDCVDKENRTLSYIINPTSVMPKFIVGGKGCGKTHALRYFSYEIRKIEHNEYGIIKGIEKDKYIGILIKSEEMNVHRFADKKISDEMWQAIFSYYFELWVARQSISIISEICNDVSIELEAQFCGKVMEIFTTPNIPTVNRFSDLISFLTGELKFIDHNVNNCIFDSGKQIGSMQIKATSGSLLFGVPALFPTVCPELDDTLFIYMIDQYEDFSISKQRYINTLIRNKRNNATFWIGSRYYGIKTQKTESAEEENKEDAEFVKINLDDFYRSDPKHYRKFSSEVIKNRLINSTPSRKINGIDIFKDNNCFYLVTRNSSSLEYQEPQKIAERASLARKYMKKIRAHLADNKLTDTTIDAILDNISAKDYPLVEKASIFTLYKEWSKPSDLLNLSQALKENITQSIATAQPVGEIQKVFEHFKSDLMAQLYQEAKSPVYNYGLDELIEISWGNPRHLLTLLKKVHPV